MRYAHLLLVAAMGLLTACSGSHRPVYSGHEESTEGVPGFVNGKKVSPYVKLGQSYSVDGEWNVPRNQPDYVEEGMASWYGPGFHGGKTANGEHFDGEGFTAAHRTLPLPSIIRVTMLSNGKQVYARVNDRGPFAHKRILDLSRSAADKIGLVRVGTAKVRVEYMPKESQRFVDLLAQGRDPKTIDLASEVLEYDGSEGSTEYARADTRSVAPQASGKKSSFWEKVSPVSSAHAEESQEGDAQETQSAAPLSEISATDLSAPAASAKPSPFAALDGKQPASSNRPARTKEPSMEVASLEPAAKATAPAASSAGGKFYVQLGAFSSQQNAERLRKQYGQLEGLQITPKAGSNGSTLYHVRLGPYGSQEAGAEALATAQQAGAEARVIRE